METEWYVRRHSDGEIVNCVTSRQRAQDVAEYVARTWPDCYADAHPPLSVLQRYRYWNERP